MWTYQLILASLFAINEAEYISPYSKNSVFSFDRVYANCSDYKKLPVSYRNVEVFKRGDTMYFNYDTFVDRVIPSDLKLIVEIERCSTKEAPDTCSHVRTLKTNNFCSFLQAGNEFWSPLMNCIKPSLICPFKKITYKGRNCSIDMSMFRLMPLENMYWKGKSIVSSKVMGGPVLCHVFSGNKQRKRN